MSGEGENGEEENDAKKKKNAEEDAPVVVPSIMDRAGTGSTPLMERYDHKSQVFDLCPSAFCPPPPSIGSGRHDLVHVMLG